MPERTQRPVTRPLVVSDGVLELLRTGALTVDENGNLALSTAATFTISNGELDIATSGVKAGMVDIGSGLSNSGGSLSADLPDETGDVTGIADVDATGYEPQPSVVEATWPDPDRMVDGDTGTSTGGVVGDSVTLTAKRAVDGCRIYATTPFYARVEDGDGNVIAGPVQMTDDAWTELTFSKLVSEWTVVATDTGPNGYSPVIAEVEGHVVPLPRHRQVI